MVDVQVAPEAHGTFVLLHATRRVLEPRLRKEVPDGTLGVGLDFENLIPRYRPSIHSSVLLVENDCERERARAVRRTWNEVMVTAKVA